MKVILSINSGSSSVKVSAYSAGKREDPRKLAECQVSGLTAPPAQLKYSRAGQTVAHRRNLVDAVINNQNDAFSLILQTLIDDSQLREIESTGSIAIACHRVVHGGDYTEPKIFTKDTYHHVKELSDLAPLHNGPALVIIDSCIKQLPEAVNVACFDSQFHVTMPAHISAYPIDQDIARRNQLRKYGFHGISYSFIRRSVAEYLGKDPEKLNIIALHLGSGASACAIKGGKSYDTSMGLTPLAGLPGATRSGNVDPSLVFHYTSNAGRLEPGSTSQLHISKAEEILNEQAGWKALTGTTDFGSISDSTDEKPSHRLAFDLFVDRIGGFLAQYFVSLGAEVDALVFAGGIGENDAKLRSAVVTHSKCLGFTIDPAANEAAAAGGGPVRDVGRKDDQYRVLVCQTDEALEMARECTQMEGLWS